MPLGALYFSDAGTGKWLTLIPIYAVILHVDKRLDGRFGVLVDDTKKMQESEQAMDGNPH